MRALSQTDTLRSTVGAGWRENELTKGSKPSNNMTFQSNVGHGLNMPRPFWKPVRMLRWRLSGAIQVIQLK